MRTAFKKRYLAWLILGISLIAVGTSGLTMQIYRYIHRLPQFTKLYLNAYQYNISDASWTYANVTWSRCFSPTISHIIQLDNMIVAYGVVEMPCDKVVLYGTRQENYCLASRPLNSTVPNSDGSFLICYGR